MSAIISVGYPNKYNQTTFYEMQTAMLHLRNK